MKASMNPRRRVPAPQLVPDRHLDDIDTRRRLELESGIGQINVSVNVRETHFGDVADRVTHVGTDDIVRWGFHDQSQTTELSLRALRLEIEIDLALTASTRTDFEVVGDPADAGQERDRGG